MTQPLRVPPLRGLSLLTLLAASAVLAESSSAPGFALSRFDPSERGSRFFTTESLDWRSDAPTLGLVVDYAYNPLVIYQVTPNGPKERFAVVRNFAVGEVGGSIGLGERFRVGLALPMVLYADGGPGQLGLVSYAAPQRSGIGDLRVSADMRFYGTATDHLRFGAGVRVYVPTGDPKAFASDGAIRATVQVQGAGEIASFIGWSARLGARFSGLDSTYAGGQLGHQMLGAVAIGWRGLGGRLLIAPEVAAATTFGQAFSMPSTAVDLMLGAHFDITPNWRIGGALGRGATVALGSESARGVVSLEWVPPTEDVACRQALKDREAADRAQAEQQASDAAQRRAAEQALASQLAKQAAAKRLAFEESETQRRAAEKAAAEHAAADDDGDGIANGVDGCPNEAGFASADQAKNGCPTGAVIGDQVVVEPVRFETNSDHILAESNAILEKVLAAIGKLPQSYRYRIEGHTDDRGPASFNTDLSRRRAISVMGWMTAHGVDGKRLEAAGFGPGRPVAPNDSEANRLSNRRVEFHIINLEVKP
jgi:outer membrane protein OmpA-like peptidoglycan-associated protein